MRERVLRRTAHARERAREHYGLILAHEDILAISEIIENFLSIKNRPKNILTDVVWLGSFPETFPPSALFAFLFKDRPLYIIYSPLLKLVFTILSLKSGEDAAKRLVRPS